MRMLCGVCRAGLLLELCCRRDIQLEPLTAPSTYYSMFSGKKFTVKTTIVVIVTVGFSNYIYDEET